MTERSSSTRADATASVPDGLTVTAVAQRCHLSESTLRMWERRYAFPCPGRDRWGNRRYAPREVQRIEDVLRLRDTGLSLPAAIARVGRASAFHSPSLFTDLRAAGARQLPEVAGPALALIARALEDEYACRGDEGILLCGMGAAAPELVETDAWAALGAGSRLTIAFGAFADTAAIAPGRLQVALRPEEPFGREVFLVADSPTFACALVAWQIGGRPGAPLADRVYEAAWTLQPALVRTLAALCLERAGHELPDRVEDELVRSSESAPADNPPTEIALAITERVLAYVARPSGPHRRQEVLLT